MVTTDRSSKTTVRILRLLRERLDELLAANGLKRDAYLNLVLSVEVPALDKEVPKSNSQAARRYIASRLQNLHPRDLVTLTLREDLVFRLDQVCQKKRISRDAFFNRLYFLLTADPEAIDGIFFAGDHKWRERVWEECKHDGPFFTNTFYPLRRKVDPFWAIRAGIKLYREAGHEDVDDVYQASLWQSGNKREPIVLSGMSCYFPDSAIPRSEESRKLEALFGIARTGRVRP